MRNGFPQGLLVSVSLLAVACRAPAATHKDQPRRSACDGKTVIALVDVNVIAMGSAHVWPHHTVAWCGDTIVDVAPRAELKLPPDTTILEAPGAYVMPGLADMHTHLIRPQDLTLYVTHGVTTVRNMWGAPMHLEWRKQVIAGTRVGPRIFTAGPIVDGPRPVHQGSIPLSDAAQAGAVVGFHQAQGYDFIKIYSGLEAEPFGALMEQANAAGLKVVGHIPRAVGLEAAVKAGLHGVEHQDGSLEFLQAEDSPVKGKWDRASRSKKILHVDESRIPALAALLKAVQSCPTRVVKDGFGPSALAREKLASPAAKYVPACERAIWEPTSDLSPDAAVAYQKQVELEEKIIRGLRDARAPLLAGTDPANPLVIPGHSVHEELAHLVRSGLTPFEALYSATRAASEAVGTRDRFGSIHPGRAADLVLLGGNPLEDIHQTRNILGVVVAGRHLDAKALTALRENVATSFSPEAPLFEDPPPWKEPAPAQFEATYAVSWKNAAFGAERIWMGPDHTFHAQAFDPHTGQTVTAHGNPQRLVVRSDGAAGRGEITVQREGRTVSVAGTTLAGGPVQKTFELDPTVMLGMDHMVVGTVLMAGQLAALTPGASQDVTVAELSLGSTVDLEPKKTNVTRVKSAGVEMDFELQQVRGPPARLRLDARGHVSNFEFDAFGSVVRYARVEDGSVHTRRPNAGQ